MNSDSTLSVPIPSSYWVRPGQFLAGEYPGSKNEAEARQRLQRFLQSGVELFLDLTGEDELLPYAHLLPVNPAAQVSHQRFPIRDFNTPTSEQMIATLNALDAALALKQVVYVHCWGGIGRTGTVVGCYLARHGLTGDAALAEIKRLRRNVPFADRIRQSPETNAQRQMVLSWQNGQ